MLKSNLTSTLPTHVLQGVEHGRVRVPQKDQPLGIATTWICMATMLGKSSKHILPNGGLMVIYHSTMKKKLTLNKSKLPHEQ